MPMESFSTAIAGETSEKVPVAHLWIPACAGMTVENLAVTQYSASARRTQKKAPHRGKAMRGMNGITRSVDARTQAVAVAFGVISPESSGLVFGTPYFG
jgi:hypothetical protein